LLLCVYGVASGVKSQNVRFGSGPLFLYVGVIVFFLGAWGLMEIGHQIYIRQFQEFWRPITTMTEDEFYAITRKGKRHLLLLDDLVLDGTDYAPYHPGGRFIIERTRGTDISKFFYGGYNLEPQNNGTNYNHTNYARMACNGLIIAKLVRGVDTGLV